MKNILIISLLLVSILAMGQGPVRPPFATIPASSGAAADDLADIHYFFNNNSDDDSGNDYDASTTSMSYSSTSPAEGSHSGTFVSTSTYFTVPSGYSWSSPFSISLWFKTTATSGFPEFLSPFVENGTWEYWRLWLRVDNKNVEFRGYQNSTNTLDLANTLNSVWATGTWTHVVFVYDNGDCELYVDGTDETNDSGTWNTSNMKIDWTSVDIGRWFNGNIDDLSIYSFALTSTQVTTLYNSGTAGTVLTE